MAASGGGARTEPVKAVAEITERGKERIESPMSLSSARPGATEEPQPLILILEDEAEIAELVELRLAEEGFRTRIVLDPREAVRAVAESQPSLVLLDVIMPGISGIEVARQLKANAATRLIPIIFLTGQGAEPDIVAGLELGADDYLTKPFSYSVLVARIRAVLRRGREERPASDALLRTGTITLSEVAHEVSVDGISVSLTLAEFHLLASLMRQRGRVLTRKQLLESIADSPDSLIERNVDVHIGTLRKKLGSAGMLITTVRGVGYKCKDGD